MVSCTKEMIMSGEEDPDVISYRVFTNNPTKSGVVDNSHLGNMGSLYISAIGLDQGNYYFSNNVILSEDISSSTANSGSTSFYWPYFKLGFYAANRSMTVTESSAAKLTPSIDGFTVSRRALNDPEELMVALEAMQKSPSGTPVQIGLHHALSRISVRAQNTIQDYVIRVAGVQIGGFSSEGTFTFPRYSSLNAPSDAVWRGLVSSSYDADPEDQIDEVNNLDGCWGSQSTPLQYGYLNLSEGALSGILLTSEFQNLMDDMYFYVIPQSVTQTASASGNSPAISDHYIDLLLNVKRLSDGVQVYPAPADADMYAVSRVYIPGGHAFEAGKSYVISLDFHIGVGVSESIATNGALEELYNGTVGMADALALLNLRKDVSADFADDEFIVGQSVDFGTTVGEWGAVAEYYRE